MNSISRSDFDRIDLKLIELLQANARASVVELAKKVNLSPTPCTLRIRRLE
jgi:Lrp/AsnC family leucine-responsive transcriptional regulator